ncbi:murein L,D-transpeptidase [Mangrovimicrobium sediminis]|uniref:Murein L,D-transpeptidase n=1 Tax=Mangrovimicrobium sediminis TaxID=2562682 RepID=A0A4Z0M8L0_9GAMM|nr:L,D-transpeptidase [Haliea sp. SAOS-164]TGD75814.1 murein L,D-transpeptidase [Haliea sp. SAOS-164]
MLTTAALLPPLALGGEESAAHTDPLWLLIDTSALTLAVMRGDAEVARYDNIAIGSGGAAADKRLGDERTPLGEFHISEIRPSDRFLLFLALDYPTLKHAERAWGDGRIDERTWQRIRLAWTNGGPPPQDTALGGHLGIHGIGAGDPEIQATINWTNGCIALTNAQVTELAGLVTVGTRVSIR